ncbi:protein prenylyltransferase [Trichodelitschia bisporula]|uniref:Protein farnesyltransferase/geranylgeranyltransferase type-1 subunit alpha n=1 Tax=Trichodelitschia bisporula TaxID=703511 RepID=A0A6G1IBR9_9PEZI|nr:protein prenylyltransferase [Trichodelitschia bisporula]
MSYSASPLWADIVPLPQDDGPGQPLAAIAYSEKYSEAMSYLRAVMASNEMSERALDLTSDIIALNPAHYTVWLYRVRILLTLKKDLHAELSWMNPVALVHLKNYQIWHHRQTIINALNNPDGETDFISKMFAKDAKNYHVWSYRQWLVKRFSLWDAGELEFTEQMLKEDVRNNSAWNHRWYVVFGRGDEAFADPDIVMREVFFTQQSIRLAPQNPSPWNYLRALARRASGPAALPLSSLQPFANTFAPLSAPDAVKSTHALDLLAEIHSENEADKDKAYQALELLATRYDPIRANYWNYRRATLEGVKTV